MASLKHRNEDCPSVSLIPPELEPPAGWKVGWKVVTHGNERRPTAGSYRDEITGSISWFSRLYPSGAPSPTDFTDSFSVRTMNEKHYQKNRKRYARNAQQIQYLKGTIVKARNEDTGTTFENVGSLVKFRRRIGLSQRDYGPGIHVYTDHIYAGHAFIFWNAEFEVEASIISVAYDPDDIVDEHGDGKIAVFKVLVLD